MLLKKIAEGQTSKTKAMVIGKNVIEELRKLNGKNLLGIDEALSGKLVDIKKITTKMKDGGDEITSIGLEFKDRIILVPTSRNFDHSCFEDDTWFKSVLYIRNKKNELTDGEGEYTGPEVVSFGMPGELDVVENKSLVEAVEVK